MTTHLLDASVLIAAVVTDHEHHVTVSRWLAGAGPVALCPIVQGALVRWLVRTGEGVSAASEILRRWHSSEQVEFWPADVSYADADLAAVRGHKQVTDVYLLSLTAARPGARFATLDQAAARLRPDLVTLIQ